MVELQPHHYEINQPPLRRLSVRDRDQRVRLCGIDRFPKDKPAFTIEVPAGWKADYNLAPSSVFVADAELKNSFMAIAMPGGTIISDKDAAAATLKKFLEQDLKENIKDETFSDPTEMTIAGETAYSIKATTKDGGPTNEFLVFAPDGKSYFVGMTNGDVKAVLNSIKAAK